MIGLILLKETCSCGQVWILLQMFRVLTRGESLVTNIPPRKFFAPRVMTLIWMSNRDWRWWTTWRLSRPWWESMKKDLQYEFLKDDKQSTILSNRDFDYKNTVSQLPTLPCLSGVGLENWLFYSCVGKRTGSYAWAAQNLAQHVPGLYPASVWLLDFFY